MSNGKSTLNIFIFIGCCLILAGLIISYPKSTQAEISTAKDWIGLFPTGAADGKANAVEGKWVYANSCTQTAGANPGLNNPTGCSFAFGSTPTSGNFEFRLYANDQETAAALIAKSNTVSAATASPSPGTGVNCPAQTAYPRVQDGLITASGISDNFGSPAANCVLGSPALFAPFKIPTYDDLKSLYYTQSKVTDKPTIASSSLSSISDQYVYYRAGDLTVNGLSGNATAVVFVDGNLNLGGNLNSSATNVVFVVKGNIIIDSLVTTINAILISQGIIYTAGAGCNTNSISASALTINGSLISLNTTDGVPIKFCRTLGSNSLPAEKIINQPKYLVILRNLMSDTYQKWAEIQ